MSLEKHPKHKKYYIEVTGPPSEHYLRRIKLKMCVVVAPL